MNTLELWKKTGLNTLFSLALFTILFLALWLVEYITHSSTLLRWNEAAWCIGIPASIIGVGYVLSIRNPQNYTGFYPGIVMSLLLAVQFFLQGQYDLTALNICIFIPFQIMSIVNWRKPQQSGDFNPAFLSVKTKLLSVFVFVATIVLDWIIVTYVINHDSLFEGWTLKLFGSLMIASSILANFWLIYRKTDSWIYWFVYSLSGIVFFALIGNAFSIVLFCFFLVINSMAGVSWIRQTPKENYGWLRGK